MQTALLDAGILIDNNQQPVRIDTKRLRRYVLRRWSDVYPRVIRYGGFARCWMKPVGR